MTVRKRSTGFSDTKVEQSIEEIAKEDVTEFSEVEEIIEQPVMEIQPSPARIFVPEEVISLQDPPARAPRNVPRFSRLADK